MNAIAAKTCGNVFASGQPEADMKNLWQNSVHLQQLGSWKTVSNAVVNASGQNSPNDQTEAQIAALSRRRFDGVITNASHQEVIILEVKRTSDRSLDYCIEGRRRAQEQYGDLIQALGDILRSLLCVYYQNGKSRKRGPKG